MPQGIPYLQPQFYRPRQNGSSFVPTDIGGCETWVAARLQGGYVNNDPVSLWEDQSGNGNDWTQGSGAQQPTYLTNIQNGYPAIRCTASNNTEMTSSISGTLPGSLFAVIIPRSSLSGYVGVFSIEVGPLMLANLGGDDKWGTFSSGNNPSNTQLIMNTPYVLVLSTSGEFYSNGSSDGTYGGGSVNQGSRIGGTGGQRFDGDILELAYYNNPINATQAGQLMSYAQSTYSF